MKKNSGIYLCDYHVHTSFSFDASGTIEDCCETAISQGLDEIGFSEHVGIDTSDEAYGTLDFEGYARAVDNAREKYDGRLEIRFGVEIDFRSHVIQEIADFIEKHDFDFVMGGIHYIDGEMIIRTGPFESRPWREIWNDYFSEMRKMAHCGLFDIIAHFDVAKRGHVPIHGPFAWQEYEGSIREILEIIIKTRAALEINTAGLRKQANEILPGQGVLNLYRKLGGELVTFGSDAHSPAKVGCDLDKGMRAASEAGLTHVAVYRNRKVSLLPFCPGTGS